MYDFRDSKNRCYELIREKELSLFKLNAMRANQSSESFGQIMQAEEEQRVRDPLCRYSRMSQNICLFISFFTQSSPCFGI